jgi:hypothetical protein
MADMEQRISLVTLGVADLARVGAFHEALGWRGAKQPDDEVCFFQASGMVFGGIGGHAPAPTFFGAYAQWMASAPPSWDDVAWLREQWGGPVCGAAVT